jgi:hypothetical protein
MALSAGILSELSDPAPLGDGMSERPHGFFVDPRIPSVRVVPRSPHTTVAGRKPFPRSQES